MSSFINPDHFIKKRRVSTPCTETALLNADIVNKILIYCNVKDLIYNLRLVSKKFRYYSESVLNEILQIIIEKYYSKSYIENCNNMQPFSNKDLILLLSTQTVLIIRGFVTYKLELETKKWSRCSDTRRDRGHFAVAYLKGYVYAIGTLNLIATATVERYNLLTNTWYHVASLPNHLQSVASAVCQQKLYVIGGIDANTNITSKSIYEYNEILDVWVLLPRTIQHGRSRHSIIEYQGKIWIAGGRLQEQPATRRYLIVLIFTNIIYIYNFFNMFYYI